MTAIGRTIFHFDCKKCENYRISEKNPHWHYCQYEADNPSEQIWEWNRDYTDFNCKQYKEREN